MSKEESQSLSKELSRVENQDILDQLEGLHEEHASIYDEIEEYEYTTNPSRSQIFRGEVDSWGVESLRLKRHERSDGAVEYESTRGTLMSKDRFREVFFDSFEMRRRRRDPSTGWMHFDRDYAARLGLPVARLGHPFITDIQTLLNTDDRGRAYAMWRSVGHIVGEERTEERIDLYLRFDFLVEADLARETEFIEEQGLVFGAVQRRAEEAFPPLFSTIWIDADGGRVTNPAILDELSQPYRQPRDTNVSGARWEIVDSMGVIANWERVCQTTMEAAEVALWEEAELTNYIAAAMDQLDSTFQKTKRRLEARIASVSQLSGDADALIREEMLHHCLQRIVESPRVRLDAVGAIFLASKNPFSL